MGVLRLDGARLYYQLAGAGEPLVLLHGLGASSADWEYQVPALSRRFQVIVTDFRGHGASDRTGDYGVERFAADTWRLLDHLQVRSPVLVGHSMGGAVAMQMALDRPGAVRALVLANTLPSFLTDTVAKRAMLWTRLLLMGLLGPRRLSEIMTRRLYPHPHQARLRAKVARRNARNDRNVYLASIRALTRWSVRERVAELALPVLVLASEHDYFDGGEIGRFLAALPDGRLVRFGGARHGLPLERPEEFNRAVLE
ncbi:MAG: alpha/beta fold hydrolase, partial [Nevskiaceae bacterium]